jgi:hypothetical protein
MFSPGLGAVESGPRAGDIGSPQRSCYRAALICEGFKSVSRKIMTGGLDKRKSETE